MIKILKFIFFLYLIHVFVLYSSEIDLARTYSDIKSISESFNSLLRKINKEEETKKFINQYNNYNSEKFLFKLEVALKNVCYFEQFLKLWEYLSYKDYPDISYLDRRIDRLSFLEKNLRREWFAINGEREMDGLLKAKQLLWCISIEQNISYFQILCILKNISTNIKKYQEIIANEVKSWNNFEKYNFSDIEGDISCGVDCVCCSRANENSSSYDLFDEVLHWFLSSERCSFRVDNRDFSCDFNSDVKNEGLGFNFFESGGDDRSLPDPVCFDDNLSSECFGFGVIEEKIPCVVNSKANKHGSLCDLFKEGLSSEYMEIEEFLDI